MQNTRVINLYFELVPEKERTGMALTIIRAKTSQMKKTWCKNLIPGIGQAKDKKIFSLSIVLEKRGKNRNGAGGNMS